MVSLDGLEIHREVQRAEASLTVVRKTKAAGTKVRSSEQSSRLSGGGLQ